MSYWLYNLCSLDGVTECNSIRVPKIRTIFGVVGMLKLLAGEMLHANFPSKSTCAFRVHSNRICCQHKIFNTILRLFICQLVVLVSL